MKNISYQVLYFLYAENTFWKSVVRQGQGSTHIILCCTFVLIICCHSFCRTCCWNFSMHIDIRKQSLSTLLWSIQAPVEMENSSLNPTTHTPTHSDPPCHSVLFTLSNAFTLWLRLRMTDWVYNWWRPRPVQHFVLSPTFWSTQAVQDRLGGVGWVGGMGRSCSHPSHSTQGWQSQGRRPIRVERLDKASKPATPLGNDRLVSAVLVNTVGVKIQGDALTVFTVQLRLLILSPLSPSFVSSVITRGPRRFAILWLDRFLQKTWILSFKNSESFSLLPLCMYLMSDTWGHIDFLHLFWDIATLKLYINVWVDCWAVSCLFLLLSLK